MRFDRPHQWPQRTWDWPTEVGAIVPGKAADLIAIQGNPLEDIKPCARVDVVMKDGIVIKSPEAIEH